MRPCYAFLGLVLGSAITCIGLAQAEDGGKEFVPKNGMYTIVIPDGEKSREIKRVIQIDAPAPPIKTKTKAKPKVKQSMPIEGSVSVLKDGTSFIGASIGIPVTLIRDIPKEKRLDAFQELLVTEMKGKVAAEKETQKNMVEGKEYQIEKPNGFARMQLYVVAGWVMYAIVDGKTKEDVNSKMADEFFESFKMTDKAKEVFIK